MVERNWVIKEQMALWLCKSVGLGESSEVFNVILLVFARCNIITVCRVNDLKKKKKKKL